MSVNLKKKLTPKDWNPKRLLATADTVRTLDLGVLIGFADGITSTTSPQGEVLEGATGMFKFTDHGGADPIGSGVLWFPSGMGGEVIETVRQGNKVEFAYVVGVSKAENPAGYEWFMRPIMEAGAADPLAALEARVKESLPQVAGTPVAIEHVSDKPKSKVK